MDFENVRALLWQFKDEFSGYGSTLISFAMLLGGIGAFLYIAVRVWGHIARAEAIDVYPLLRPFAIALVIMSFPSFVQGIDSIFKPLADSTAQIAGRDAEELKTVLTKYNDIRRKEDTKIEEKPTDEKQKDFFEKASSSLSVIKSEIVDALSLDSNIRKIERAVTNAIVDAFQFFYSGVSFFIETAAVFSLVIMSIFGPVAFGISIFEGFGNNLVSWISRYINLLLWAPIANVLKGLLSRIQIFEINQMLAKVAEDGDWGFMEDAGIAVFYVLGALCFFMVPTIASWIVSPGGNVNAIGSKAMGFVTGLAGAAGTVAGLATGVPIKIVSDTVSKSRESSSSESETTRQG